MKVENQTREPKSIDSGVGKRSWAHWDKSAEGGMSPCALCTESLYLRFDNRILNNGLGSTRDRREIDEGLMPQAVCTLPEHSPDQSLDMVWVCWSCYLISSTVGCLNSAELNLMPDELNDPSLYVPEIAAGLSTGSALSVSRTALKNSRMFPADTAIILIELRLRECS